MSFAARALFAAAVVIAIAVTLESPCPVLGAPAAAPMIVRDSNEAFYNITFFDWEDCSGGPESAETFEMENQICSGFPYPICQGSCAAVILAVDPQLSLWNMSVWITNDCSQMPTYSSGKFGVCSQHPLIPYNFVVQPWNATEPTKEI